MKRQHVLSNEKFCLTVDAATGEGAIVSPLNYDFGPHPETEGSFTRIDLSPDDLREITIFLQMIIRE